jgi:hypothetical protein
VGFWFVVTIYNCGLILISVRNKRSEASATPVIYYHFFFSCCSNDGVLMQLKGTKLNFLALFLQEMPSSDKPVVN